MNIVFWFLTILALMGVWFLLSSVFTSIGSIASSLFNKAKDEINKDE